MLEITLSDSYYDSSIYPNENIYKTKIRKFKVECIELEELLREYKDEEENSDTSLNWSRVVVSVGPTNE